MNDRKKQSQPLTKLDLAVRFTVVVSVSLFGIALTLDADEAPQPATKALPVIAPRQVDSKPTRNPMIFDNSIFERLSRKQAKTAPKTVAPKIPVMEHPAQKVSAKKTPLKRMPLQKSPRKETPATKTAAKVKSQPADVWQLDEELLEKPAKTRHPLANKTPVVHPQPKVTKKPEPWKLIPGSLSQTRTTRKASTKSISKTADVKSPQPVKNRSRGFRVPLEKLTAQFASTSKKNPQRTKPSSARKLSATKKPNSPPIRQRLANLYSKVAPRKSPKVATRKPTTVVKPVKHVEKPAANAIKTAAVKQPTTKPTAKPLWDLNKPNDKSTKNLRKALAPVSVVKTTPPVSKTKIPQPPTAPKPSESSSAKRPQPPVQRAIAKKLPTKKSTPRLLQLRNAVGKLFPGKSTKSPSIPKTKVAVKDSLEKETSKSLAAKTKETKSDSLPPVLTLTEQLKGKEQKAEQSKKPKRKFARLPLDEELVAAKPEKPARTYSLDEVKRATNIKPVAASEDPVFDLRVIDDFDFQSLPPLVAERKQPPAPAGGAEDDPDTLGYNGFKPIGDVTVDIDVVKGEDPPDLAAAEFDEIEPVVVNTEWTDQTLTAPLLPFYHQPLYFEDPNAERCGKTWGILQPAASAGLFYLTIPALPYLIGAYPPEEEVESFGDCAYGCKYKLHEAYVPRFSLKGIALQGAATTGLIYLIP